MIGAPGRVELKSLFSPLVLMLSDIKTGGRRITSNLKKKKQKKQRKRKTKPPFF